MFGRKLVDDVKQAWKWGSIRFLALGAACQTVVITCPAQVAQHVPEWAWQTLSCFSVFCMIAAGVSRITVAQETPNVRNPDTQPSSN